MSLININGVHFVSGYLKVLEYPEAISLVGKHYGTGLMRTIKSKIILLVKLITAEEMEASELLSEKLNGLIPPITWVDIRANQNEFLASLKLREQAKTEFSEYIASFEVGV